MTNPEPIPDESPTNLQEKLLLEQAKAGMGRPIQGGTRKPLGDATRLVATYGGSPGDWVKMTTTKNMIIDSITVQVHLFRNILTGQNVEFKFKGQYPKTAPTNQ